MGQQQLLLLVLGIVIVGLSVVVGIQAFGENQKKANADALVNDAIRLASDAQAWKMKPVAFGGGADADGFEDLTLEQLGYKVVGGIYKNINGSFSIAATAASVVITASSTEGSANDNRVVVTVKGTNTTDISTAVNTVDDVVAG